MASGEVDSRGSRSVQCKSRPLLLHIACRSSAAALLDRPSRTERNGNSWKRLWYWDVWLGRLSFGQGLCLSREAEKQRINRLEQRSRINSFLLLFNKEAPLTNSPRVFKILIPLLCVSASPLMQCQINSLSLLLCFSAHAKLILLLGASGCRLELCFFAALRKLGHFSLSLLLCFSAPAKSRHPQPPRFEFLLGGQDCSLDARGHYWHPVKSTRAGREASNANRGHSCCTSLVAAVPLRCSTDHPERNGTEILGNDYGIGMFGLGDSLLGKDFACAEKHVKHEQRSRIHRLPG